MPTLLENIWHQADAGFAETSKMPIKALIFDLDGTLLNSIADLSEAINRMLRENGYPEQPLEVFPQYIGDGIKALVQRALPQAALDRGELEARVADYQRHYEDTWNDQSHPYDGILDVLRTLDAEGFKLCVLSNKPQAFTKLCTDHFFGEIPFCEVRGARDDIPRKPDPTAALLMLNGLGLKPDEAGYVGDSGIDMEMATRAGMLPIGVKWGFRSEQELRTHGAKLLLDTPAQLLTITKAD